MAIAYVKSAGNAAFPTTGSAISMSIVPGAVGNVLVVTAYQFSTLATLTISDTSGITWLTVVPLSTGNGVANRSWYGYTVGTASTTITISLSGSQNFTVIITADEFSGLASSSALDVGSSASGSGAAPNPIALPSITPTQNNDLFWASCYCGSITAIGSGFTAAGHTDVAWNEFKVISGGAGVAVTPNWTTNAASNNYNSQVATFKAPGTTVIHSLALLGCGA